MTSGNGKEVVIEVRDLVVGFGDHIVLDHVDLDVYRGEILGFVGGSGAGKSVLMRTIIGLLPKKSGTIKVFGIDLATASEAERQAVERRWGVLFQQGALFSSLTVRENLQFPIREYLQVSQQLLDELAIAKLEMVGLDASVLQKFPSELSGGMTKRVALARALALDPEIVFLDEPTSGLDPIGAGDFDSLIATLQRTLGLTVFMVTHDLDSLHTVCDRIAVLADHKVIAAGTMDTMLASDHPWLRAYFHGKRSRAGETIRGGSRRADPVEETVGLVDWDAGKLPRCTSRFSSLFPVRCVGGGAPANLGVELPRFRARPGLRSAPNHTNSRSPSSPGTDRPSEAIWLNESRTRATAANAARPARSITGLSEIGRLEGKGDRPSVATLDQEVRRRSGRCPA